MIPSADMIERWATETDDGYVKIPASSWPELLWVLRAAEHAEFLVADAKELVAAHERRAKNIHPWTLSETAALTRIRGSLQRIANGVRSFGE